MEKRWGYLGCEVGPWRGGSPEYHSSDHREEGVDVASHTVDKRSAEYHSADQRGCGPARRECSQERREQRRIVRKFGDQIGANTPRTCAFHLLIGLRSVTTQTFLGQRKSLWNFTESTFQLEVVC